MAWEDNLLEASFKGVTFDCVAVKDSAERDVATYLYPYLDGGDTDDKGRGIRQIQVTAVFFGDDYDVRLQAFLALLDDEAGPGELVHPVYGSIKQAQLRSREVEHDAEHVDYAQVSMAFLEHQTGNPFFARELSSQKADAAAQQGEVSQELSAKAFTDRLSALKVKPGIIGRLNNIRNVVNSVVGGVRGLVGFWTGVIDDVVSFPMAFISDLSSTLTGLVDLRSFDGESLMPSWRSLSGILGNIIKLPAQAASGSMPSVAGTSSAVIVGGDVAGSDNAAAIPIDADDLRMIDAVVSVVVAQTAINQAAEILAAQEDQPTMSPADIEQMVADVRELVQVAIDAQRNHPPVLDGADPIVETLPVIERLRTAAKVLQDAGQDLINLRPPLRQRAAPGRANLRLLAFRWYGSHERAAELARLNPDMRNPNAIREGDQVNAFLR